MATLYMSDEQAADMLGVTLNDPPEVVREAFRRLACSSHPDLNPAETGFVDLGRARSARDQLVRRWARRSRPGG